MTFLFSVAFLLSSFSSAQQACWQQEKDPQTKKVFTEEAWSNSLQMWEEQMPTAASYYSLGLAWVTYQAEYDTAQTLKNDKKKHCYMGCRITQDVSYETSVYLAWLKESDDIQDCDIKTFFEPNDQTSTLDGALYGKTHTDAQECYDFCSQYKLKK